jgi:hypothetical protein
MLIGYEFDRHSLWEGNGPARLGAGPDHQSPQFGCGEVYAIVSLSHGELIAGL